MPVRLEELLGLKVLAWLDTTMWAKDIHVVRGSASGIGNYASYVTMNRASE